MCASYIAVGVPERLVLTGSVFMFVPGAGGWEFDQELIGTDAMVGDYFGYPMAMARSSSTLAVAALAADYDKASTTYTDGGAGYVFVIPAVASSDDGGCAAPTGSGGRHAATWIAFGVALVLLRRQGTVRA